MKPQSFSFSSAPDTLAGSLRELLTEHAERFRALYGEADAGDDSDNDSDRMLLCIDRDAPMVTNQPEVPLFENGEPSPFTQNAIEFCKEFRQLTSESYGYFILLTY